MRNNKTNRLGWVGMGLLVGSLGMQANAAVVYEGFAYTAGTAIDSVGSVADGWAGAWSASSTDARGIPEVGADLTFPSLVTTGGSHIRPQRYGVSQSSRNISTASQAALTGDNTTAWFSVLMSPNVGGNGYAVNSHGAIAFGDTAFVDSTNPGSVPPAIGTNGNAVGVSFDGIDGDFSNVNIRGVTYKNGARTWDTANINTGGSTMMIVGKIEWATNGNNDVISLYNITDPTAALPTAFATMSDDWDQSTFNVVALGQGQTERFDEIRLDTTLAGVGVVPVPEPSSTALLGLGLAGLIIRRRRSSSFTERFF